MNHSSDRAPAATPPAPEPVARVFSLRWADGREERAIGTSAAAAALSLGYGFDDFKNLTWEEQR